MTYIASLHLHALIANYHADPNEYPLPPMSEQTTFEHLAKADLRQCTTVSNSVKIARKFVLDNYNWTNDCPPAGSNGAAQQVYIAVTLLTNFCNYMNNLQLYIQWVAIDFLRKRYNLPKKFLKQVVKRFTDIVCNNPHRNTPLFKELETTEAISLIARMRGVLGLEDGDNDTTIDQEWIAKDLKNGHNLSISLICFMSEYQIAHSNEDYRNRQIPISPQSSAKPKFATYPTREMYYLLKKTGENIETKDRDNKSVIGEKLRPILRYGQLEVRTPDVTTEYRSLSSDGERFHIRLDKTKTTPCVIEERHLVFPSSSTVYELGNSGLSSTFYHGNQTEVRLTCINGRHYTGRDLENSSSLFAADPGVIQNTIQEVCADPTNQSVTKIGDRITITTRRIYEEAGINRMERQHSRSWKDTFSVFEGQLSATSLKNPSQQSLCDRLVVLQGTTWIKVFLSSLCTSSAAVELIIEFLTDSDVPNDLINNSSIRKLIS